MSEFGRALLQQLDHDDVAELRTLLGLEVASPVKSDGRLLTTAEVAANLAIHPETVRRAVRAGALPGTRVGGRLRFSSAAVAAWQAPEEAPERRQSAPPRRQPRAVMRAALLAARVGD